MTLAELPNLILILLYLLIEKHKENNCSFGRLGGRMLASPLLDYSFFLKLRYAAKFTNPFHKFLHHLL